MDLIFANAQFEDQGVLQDYSFDEEYGIGDSNTNTFECKIQKYNDAVSGQNDIEPISQDFILYIEFTEYGGIIDAVNSDTKTGTITFSGRTWHGVLNSFIIEPPAGYMYRTYNGEANEVLQQMISDIGMSSLFVVDTSDQSEIEILNFEVRYEKAYDAMMRMMQAYQGKLYFYFYNGQVHLGAYISVNYAANEEFDSSQVPFRVGYQYNNVNHLICLGQGEGKDRAVIHLFTDDGGEIQPYTLINNPLEDKEYILDKSQQVMTGKDEIAEVLDIPNSTILYNYKLLESKPLDWRGAYYLKYYEDGDIDETTGLPVKKLIPQYFRDEYHLTPKQPDNWNTNYEDYFYWDEEKDVGYYKYDSYNQYYIKCREGDEGAVLMTGGMSHVKKLSGEEATETYEQITWQYLLNNGISWTDNYSKFYWKSGAAGSETYSAVQGTTSTWYGNNYNDTRPDGHKIASQPEDWNRSYSSYYTREKNAAGNWVYSSIAGIPQYRYDVINKAATNNEWKREWENNWGNYYYKVKKSGSYKVNNKVTKYKAGYYTCRDAVTMGVLKLAKDKTYPTYKKGKYYIRVTLESLAPDFSKITNGVFQKFSDTNPPDFNSYPVYRKIVHDTPIWQSNKYYRLDEEVEQIPQWGSKPYYYQVLDRFAELVKSGIEKLHELADTSTLDIDLSLESNYDVLDIVGSHDEVTGIEVNKPILKKIIKIKKDILSIEYRVD